MNAQLAILIGIAVLVVYCWLLWAIGPFRQANLRIGRFFFGILPEKMQVVFTIPELRRKIFFTLGLLAIYRVGWQIPLPVVDRVRRPGPGGRRHAAQAGATEAVSAPDRPAAGRR